MRSNHHVLRTLTIVTTFALETSTLGCCGGESPAPQGSTPQGGAGLTCEQAVAKLKAKGWTSMGDAKIIQQPTMRSTIFLSTAPVELQIYVSEFTTKAEAETTLRVLGPGAEADIHGNTVVSVICPPRLNRTDCKKPLDDLR